MPASSSPEPSSRVLAGLVGSGIGASRSPWLHESEADAQGIRLIYSLYDLPQDAGADRLERLIDAAATMRFAGLNVTHPFKQAVLPLIDEVTSDAKAIGAVNTIQFKAGRTIGHNTDHLGFSEGLKRGLAGARFGTVVQLGAGGAGSATAHALLGHGTGHLLLHDVDEDRAEALASRLESRFGEGRVSLTADVPAAVATADGLVNASPVGMVGHPGMPLPESAITSSLWVADVIYFPLETELLRVARAKGCRILNGVPMVVFQAAAAFDLFTGRSADPERMLAAALDRWVDNE